MKRNTRTRDQHRAAIARGRPPCHICGQAIDYTLPYTEPMAYVVDHLVPLEAGGSDALSNKAAAHKYCNQVKSTRPYANIIRRSGALQ